MIQFLTSLIFVVAFSFMRVILTSKIIGPNLISNFSAAVAAYRRRPPPPPVAADRRLPSQPTAAHRRRPPPPPAAARRPSPHTAAHRRPPPAALGLRRAAAHLRPPPAAARPPAARRPPTWGCDAIVCSRFGFASRDGCRGVNAHRSWPARRRQCRRCAAGSPVCSLAPPRPPPGLRSAGSNDASACELHARGVLERVASSAHRRAVAGQRQAAPHATWVGTLEAARAGPDTAARLLQPRQHYAQPCGEGRLLLGTSGGPAWSKFY